MSRGTQNGGTAKERRFFPFVRPMVGMKLLRAVAWALVAITLSARAQAPLQTPPPNSQPQPQPTPPQVAPLNAHVAAPDAPSPQLARTANSSTAPSREAVRGLGFGFLGLLGPFAPPVVPPLFSGSEARLSSLVRDGKLYLKLDDAIALALENNLDVETERYNLVLAQTDEVRAAGGGSLRGIDYSILPPPNGVGGPGSPLLNLATTNANPTAPTVTDLSSLNATTQVTQSLAETAAGAAYSTGPNVPLFDPQLIGDAGYLRRSNSVALTAGTASLPQPLDFTSLNLSYLQGFSSGAQLTGIVNNDSQVIYTAASQANPFHSPSASMTLTQPLLRGFGRSVNLRYLRIARADSKISRLLFEQQVLQTVYGTSRIYFDLVSLGENVQVKQESLRAATRLREDEQEQERLGTLAPIELTRARAAESSSRFDLIQAQGLYLQQEIILRNQLLRTASPVFTAAFSQIVPTDRITVPQQDAAPDVASLVQQALARRPDLAQAALQVEAGRISANASRSNARPQLNAYANVQTRGVAEQSYDALGSAGTGLATAPQALALGGTRVSTIYQAGVQLTLPLRNRVAESDAARDAVQLRQVEARTEKLAANIRQDVETAVVALETARAACVAATQSRDYQSQLLDAEKDKLSVGQSTQLAVLQSEAYLAQARSTEIAARSNWMKARIELDRALGDLLEKNHIQLDDAIRGSLP